MTIELTPVLSRTWDVDESWTREVYERPRRLRRRCATALRDGRRDDVTPAGQGLRAARPRRRRLPDRHEVGLHPAGRRQAGLPRRQRRRVRAGHLQGHPADDGQPARADRGRDHRVLRDPREPRLHLRPRRGRARAPPAAAARSPRPTTRATSARTSSAPATTSSSPCTPAPARTSAARRRRCSTRSRAAAASRGCARRSRPSPASTRRRRSSTTSSRSPASRRIVRNGADWFRRWAPRRRGSREGSKGMTLYSLSGHVTRPGQYEAPLGITLRELLDLAGGVRDGPPAEVLDARRLVDAAAHRRAPRRAAGLRGHRGGGLDARHQGAADLRRDDLRRARGAALDRVLRPRVLRQVHAVPRGHLLAGADPAPARARRRAARRTSRSCSTSATTSSAGRSARSATVRPARSRRRCSTSATSTSRTSSTAAARSTRPPRRCSRRRGRTSPCRWQRPDDRHRRTRRRGPASATTWSRSPSTASRSACPRARWSSGPPSCSASRSRGSATTRCSTRSAPAGSAWSRCEGQPKPLASCTTTVTDGMVVKTQLTSPVADKAQQGIMELLLINHPLDCPVCDKGGECPLQNQAMSNGRAESRFDDVKRTFPKPINISSPGAARPGALRALRPVHPLLRADRRRPVHRDARARRAAAGRHLRGRAVRVLLLRQHRADLPGRRADRRGLPLPVAAVRPGVLARRLRALRVRLRDPHRPPARQGAAPAGRRRPAGQRGVELRQGPLGLPVRHRAGPPHDAAGPRRRRHARPDVLGRGAATSRPRGWPRPAARPACWSAGAPRSRTPTPTRSSPGSRSAPTTSTSAPARTPPRRPTSSPRTSPARGLGVTYADLEQARVGAARRARARGGVADRLPAAAQGGAASGLRGASPSRRSPRAGWRSCRARCSRPRPAPRPRCSTPSRRSDDGSPTRPRRCTAPASRDPRRRAAGRRARRAVAPSPRWPRPPAPGWPGCRAGPASAARSRPARCPACCPAAVRSPTPPRAPRSRRPGASTACRPSAGRDTSGDPRRGAHRRAYARCSSAASTPTTCPTRPRRSPRSTPRRSSSAWSCATSAVTERADVVLPVAPVVEKAGTFLDWEGRERPVRRGAARHQRACRTSGCCTCSPHAMDVDLGLPDVAAARARARRARRSGTATAPPFARLDAGRAGRRRRRRGRPGHLAAAARRRPAAGRRAVPRRHRPRGRAPGSPRPPPPALGVADGDAGDRQHRRAARSRCRVVVTDMPDGVVWLPTNCAGCAVRRDLARRRRRRRPARAGGRRAVMHGGLVTVLTVLASPERPGLRHRPVVARRSSRRSSSSSSSS